MGSMPFATFMPLEGLGKWSIVRNGSTQASVSIGTANILVEAKLPNGNQVAFVRREQVNGKAGVMLELCVEHEIDPVIMLIGSIAVLRHLPAHVDTPRGQKHTHSPASESVDATNTHSDWS